MILSSILMLIISINVFIIIIVFYSLLKIEMMIIESIKIKSFKKITYIKRVKPKLYHS